MNKGGKLSFPPFFVMLLFPFRLATEPMPPV